MSLRGNNFILVNATRLKPPSVDWLELKNRILPKNYALSLAFIGEKTARGLSKRYAKKNKTPNVLAFPVSQKEGEVFLTLKRVKKEASGLGYSLRCYAAFLYVHGLLHLAGYNHKTAAARERMNKKTGVELKRLKCVLPL